MQYLCLKQLTIGKTIYHSGDRIPDNVILPTRSEKLIKNGYLSKIEEELENYSENQSGLFTKEQVDKMIAEAITPMKQKEEELQQVVADLKKCKLTEHDDTIPISIKKEADGENGQIAIILVTPDEIQQAFSIMQQNADEGSKAIATIKSENVLILLHAADSRKTIKEAAKKQADNLFSSNDNINESKEHNETTSMN